MRSKPWRDGRSANGAREYGYRMGIAMVLGLMVFVTWNDLLQLRIVDFIVGLVT